MLSTHNLHWALLLALAALGCSSTICDDALDKAQSCGLEDVTLNDAAEECEAFAACQGQCIVDGSCNDVQALRTDPFAENELSQCMFECGE